MKIDDLTFEKPTYILDEQNTDIEKWRRMNPMNYFKALQLLLTAGQQFPDAREIVVGEMFKSIYQVTRLYIPDILYKFYSLTDDDEINNKKINTLLQEQIFMSNIKDFNDPFDGKAFFYNPKQLKDIKCLSSHEGRIIDDFAKFHRGTALTENNITSMPMWAHYSNNHQGFCVAYDMKNPRNKALGINGSGKTTLFNILGSSRDKRKQNLEKWKFFFLYKVDKNRFVIEGNNLSVISGIMEMKEFLSSSNRDVSPEYSLVFEYDFEQKVMRNIKMCNPGDWDNTQILYYQDLSSRVCQWSVDRNQDYEDYEIFVKRKKIRPSIKALYE